MARSDNKVTGVAGNGESKTRLSSVTTAIRLLKTFTNSDREIGISALPRKLGVSKSTVHRVATTLVRRRMDIPNEATPFLSKLRDSSTEKNHHG